MNPKNTEVVGETPSDQPQPRPGASHDSRGYLPHSFQLWLRIFLENLRKPGETAGFWNERWLKRMETESTPRMTRSALRALRAPNPGARESGLWHGAPRMRPGVLRAVGLQADLQEVGGQLFAACQATRAGKNQNNGARKVRPP